MNVCVTNKISTQGMLFPLSFPLLLRFYFVDIFFSSSVPSTLVSYFVIRRFPSFFFVIVLLPLSFIPWQFLLVNFSRHFHCVRTLNSTRIFILFFHLFSNYIRTYSFVLFNVFLLPHKLRECKVQYRNIRFDIPGNCVISLFVSFALWYLPHFIQPLDRFFRMRNALLISLTFFLSAAKQWF